MTTADIPEMVGERKRGSEEGKKKEERNAGGGGTRQREGRNKEGRREATSSRVLRTNDARPVGCLKQMGLGYGYGSVGKEFVVQT